MPRWLQHVNCRRRDRLTDERGAALVEFALVLPLLMLLLLGLVDFGKAFTMWIDETHIANQAGRYAAVGKGPSGFITDDASLAAFESAMEADADTQELRDTIDVIVCFPTGSNGTKGEAIRVNVTATYQFLSFIGSAVPSLSTSKTLSAHSVMRIEKDYPVGFAGGHPC